MLNVRECPSTASKLSPPAPSNANEERRTGNPPRIRNQSATLAPNAGATRPDGTPAGGHSRYELTGFRSDAGAAEPPGPAVASERHDQDVLDES
jgi:hypothetical protein